MSSLLDRILGAADCAEESLATEECSEMDGITRSAAFFTYSQLNGLVSFSNRFGFHI